MLPWLQGHDLGYHGYRDWINLYAGAMTDLGFKRDRYLHGIHILSNMEL